MGKRANDIEYLFETKEFRENVGKNLKKIRTKLDLRQNEVSKDLNIDVVTLSRLENGKTALTLEYLFRLSEYYKRKSGGKEACSISYLIGELNEYHTYTEKALCEQTGLTPEALQIMKEAKEQDIFLELINHIIRAFVSGKPRHSFPTAEITKYMEMIRSYKSLETHPLFETVRSLARKELSYTEIKEKIFEMGYTDKNINPTDIIQIINYTYFRDYDKRTFRIDIQDLFSDFMRSDFVEGK